MQTSLKNDPAGNATLWTVCAQWHMWTKFVLIFMMRMAQFSRAIYQVQQTKLGKISTSLDSLFFGDKTHAHSITVYSYIYKHSCLHNGADTFEPSTFPFCLPVLEEYITTFWAKTKWKWNVNRNVKRTLIRRRDRIWLALPFFSPLSSTFFQIIISFSSSCSVEKPMRGHH